MGRQRIKRLLLLATSLLFAASILLQQLDPTDTAADPGGQPRRLAPFVEPQQPQQQQLLKQQLDNQAEVHKNRAAQQGGQQLKDIPRQLNQDQLKEHRGRKRAQSHIILTNRYLSFTLQEYGLSLRLHSITNHRMQMVGATSAAVLVLNSPIFRMATAEGDQFDSDKCEVTTSDTDTLPTAAKFVFACHAPRGGVASHVYFTWQARLSVKDIFLQSNLTWRAPDMVLTALHVFTTQLSDTSILSLGSTFGASLLAPRALVFLATEHPMAANGQIEHLPGWRVTGMLHIPVTPQGITSNPPVSTVFGVVSSAEQLRREFQRLYLDRRRARPPAPFLHYNSWFDFASWQEPNASTTYANRTMTEHNCLNRVQTFGSELGRRGVHLDSFLWDDGWDK